MCMVNREYRSQEHEKSSAMCSCYWHKKQTNGYQIVNIRHGDMSQHVYVWYLD